MEDLFHHQADGQVAAVVGAQPGDGGVQVGHFLGRAQQRAIDHFDQARRQGGIATDHFAQVADADLRVFGGLTNFQGHFR